MSAVEPLDLNHIDPPIWRILVSDVAYGPYTLGQLRSFILSGRVSAQSKIAEGDGARFIPAAECSKLTSAFSESNRRKQKSSASNYVVIAPLVEDKDTLIKALNELGAFSEAMQGVFLLRSDEKLASIQGRIAVADTGEKVMIVDATNNRLAWLGLSSEVGDHLKVVWNKAA